jgi:hypothetical protein
MKYLGIRYGALLSVTLIGFGGFVACGTQLYRVSLTGDTSTTASAAPGLGEDANQDPSSPDFALFAPSGWGGSLPVHFQVDTNMTASQLAGLQAAMTTWETATGQKLFAYDGPETGVSGDTYPDLYSSLNNNINEHLLDNNWTKTGKAEVVLATTIWDTDPSNSAVIVKSDMRFNNQYYVFGDALVITDVGPRTVVDIQTLATHELGHMLGLAHVQPTVDSNSIMNPSIYIGEGLTTRHISRGDIERIQKIYGCRGTACNIDQTLATINAMVAEPSGTAAGAGSSPTNPSTNVALPSSPASN